MASQQQISHYGAMSAQAIAEGAVRAARAVESATLWPFVVSVEYTVGGVQHARLFVVQAPSTQAPNGLEEVPADARNVSASVLPASRLTDMPLDRRMNYRRHYRAYLMWALARRLGKPVADLQCFTDFDPISIDESVESWARPGRFAGD